MKKLCILLIFPFFTFNIVAQNEFSIYKDSFIEQLWSLYPSWASNSGYYKYNYKLNIPDEVNRKEQLVFSENQLAILNTISIDQLTLADKTDFFLIRDFLKNIPWELNELKEYEWNPSIYNVNGDFSYLLNTEYAPLEDRLRTINEKMKYVAAYFEAAKSNIKNPTIEHTKLAIEQNKNSVDVFSDDIPKAVELANLTKEEKIAILENANACKKSVLSFVTFLEKMPNLHPRDFRLGKELYVTKFSQQIQSEYNSDELFYMALNRKKYLHEQMFHYTQVLWKDYFTNKAIPKDTIVAIRMMIDTLSAQHIKAEDFQTSIEKHIPLLVDFINNKNLIYLDPSKPLEVRKEPAYMAGVAGASISSPGPYDKESKTYYNVGSIEGWPKDKQESYLREYNNYILQILDIHEAIPGHYTQGIYANQSPSIIKTILGNGAMIEGWAVYSELMMLENGYGNNSPEMWLMYYKWNLRSTCNTILDIGVHTQNMSKEDALDLLTRQAFQQKAEAEGKWNRVQLSNVQLCSYFSGFKEIIDLREAYKKEQGAAYSVKTFNEEFLSYGSIPVKYIKQLMLNKQK